MKALIAFLLILAVSIGAATYMLSGEEKTLPVINPIDVNPDLVDHSLQRKGIDHRISSFYLVNQDSVWVDNTILEGKIAVVNYFFVTCPSICPNMNAQVMRVNEAFKNSGEVMILSHTVWPEIDSIPALKEYAGRYNASAKTWQFLTGDKAHLYELARKSYLICPDKKDTNYDHGSENDFIHTENLALIDQKGRIRGFYNGTSAQEVDELMADIKWLIEQD